MYPYQPQPPTYTQQLQEEQWRAAATRSYTTPAVITLVLYFVLWLPGLIANIVYLNSANRAQRLTGHAPEGKGCLVSLAVIFIFLPLILLIGGVIVLLAANH